MSRRLAEEALHFAREQFRFFLKQLPFCYQSLNGDGLLKEVNQAWLNLFGYSREEVIGRWFGELLPAEDRDRFRDCFSRLKVAGEIHGVQFEIICHDGKRKVISLDGTIGPDEQGAFQRTHCMLLDITESKQVEEAYRSLVYHSIQGLIIYQDGQVVLANQALARMSGYQMEELLSLAPEKIWEIVHPEDGEILRSHHYDRLQGKPVPDRYEIRALRKDGTIYWLEIYAKLIKHQGKPAVQAIAIDITERKRAEEALQEGEARYRAVIEQSPDGIYLVDVDTRCIVEANLAFAEMLGYTSDEVQGLSVYDFVAAEQKDVDRRYQDILRTKGSITFERHWQRKDGSLLDVWVSASVISYGGRRMICAIGRDITERMRIGQALQESEEKYRSLFEESGDTI